MTIRWTEEQAKENGFIKINGEWVHKSTVTPQVAAKAFIHRINSGAVSEREPAHNESAQSSKVAKREQVESAPRDSGRTFYIVVTAYCVRNSDPDNLFIKWYLDEIVDAGIIPDDSCKYIKAVIKKVKKVSTREQERTVIEVVEL